MMFKVKELSGGVSMSCSVSPNSFSERKKISFKSKKYQKIFKSMEIDDYEGPSEDQVVALICKTASAIGVDLLLVIESWLYNGYLNKTKDKKVRTVRWSKYKTEIL